VKTSTTLLKKAESILSQSMEYTAVQMLKQAGLDENQARIEVAQSLMEKEAASGLVSQGIDYDSALAMIKVAGIKISDLAEFKAQPTDEEVLANFLTKVASEVTELEKQASQLEQAKAEIQELLEKVASLESALENAPVEMPDQISKLAQSGDFTAADLQALMALPDSTLTKVASASEQPWKMGKSAGAARDSMDPFTAFILS
jgi:hypothetical protein